MLVLGQVESTPSLTCKPPIYLCGQDRSSSGGSTPTWLVVHVCAFSVVILDKGKSINVACTCRPNFHSVIPIHNPSLFHVNGSEGTICGWVDFMSVQDAVFLVQHFCWWSADLKIRILEDTIDALCLFRSFWSWFWNSVSQGSDQIYSQCPNLEGPGHREKKNKLWGSALKALKANFSLPHRYTPWGIVLLQLGLCLKYVLDITAHGT